VSKATMYGPDKDSQEALTDVYSRSEGKWDPEKANVYHGPYPDEPPDADDLQMTTDPELKAMEKVREALEPLDSVERGRVIDWAMERFGL